MQLHNGWIRESGRLALVRNTGTGCHYGSGQERKTVVRQMGDMSNEQIDLAVKQMVKTTANNKSVLGYFIMDEPGSPEIGFKRRQRIVACWFGSKPGVSSSRYSPESLIQTLAYPDGNAVLQVEPGS